MGWAPSRCCYYNRFMSFLDFSISCTAPHLVAGRHHCSPSFLLGAFLSFVFFPERLPSYPQFEKRTISLGLVFLLNSKCWFPLAYWTSLLHHHVGSTGFLDSSSTKVNSSHLHYSLQRAFFVNDIIYLSL